MTMYKDNIKYTRKRKEIMMRGNFQGLLAQAQKMQQNIERAQAELGNMEVVGEAGAGMVRITMTCKHEAKKVQIDPSVFSGEPDDREMLEDLIAAALNDAAHKVTETTEAKMRSVTAGMPLPPGMKLPF